MTSSTYDDSGNITYRLDDETAKTVSANASTNNRALGLWRGNRSIPFLREMFGKNRMVVRMRPFNESPFTANFEISGLEDAITPLRSACNW